jgi:predicted 2-oxoglutarate/Fe(II)-dependent dioxygenase YbiX
VNNLDLISISNVPKINLEHVLNHCLSDSWKDSQIAQSRYQNGLNKKTLKDIRDSELKILDFELQDLLKKEVYPLVEKYANKMGISLSFGEGWQLVRYKAGQFFAEHVDKTEEFPRQISAVLYLNDDYEGGTITFTKLNKTFKPKANSLFIFPSSEEFMHSADPVTSGEKYVIVGFWS